MFYDEVELEDFEFEHETSTFYYPCPCGDRFQISSEELVTGERVARCPSCSLTVKVICGMHKDEFGKLINIEVMV